MHLITEYIMLFTKVSLSTIFDFELQHCIFYPIVKILQFIFRHYFQAEQPNLYIIFISNQKEAYLVEKEFSSTI